MNEILDSLKPLKLALAAIGIAVLTLPLGGRLHAQSYSAKSHPAGTMINGYTCISRFTNQIGFDFKNDIVTVIFRGGPIESYPYEGNGALVLNTTSTGGESWSGYSPIFNQDLPGSIPGAEMAARHPSIIVKPDVDGQGLSIMTVWGTLEYSQNISNRMLGRLDYKSGHLGGPYQGGSIAIPGTKTYFPSRIVMDRMVNLYSLIQTRDVATDSLTGNFIILRSFDEGVSWHPGSTTPALLKDALPEGFVYTEEAMSMDVSPDGSALYIGFVAIVRGDAFSRTNTDFKQSVFGWTRSIDNGITWSAPVFEPLPDWTFINAPGSEIDADRGFVLPSISTVVDGLNQPHFLLTIDGAGRGYSLDSAFIGELTIDPGNPLNRPEFYSIRSMNLPRFDRFINPVTAPNPQQPRLSIYQEHEWSKSEDGMELCAKWIDADSLFVTARAGYPTPTARDSIHDIFIAMKNLNNMGNGARGWQKSGDSSGIEIVNMSRSPAVDEKLTKMAPYFSPEGKRLYCIYTLFDQPFGPPGIFEDIDEQGPSDLYLLDYFRLTGVATGVFEAHEISLSQNYPNPVIPETGPASIEFSLASAGVARIVLYDMLGRYITTVVEGFFVAGSHSSMIDTGALKNGTYMYRLESGGVAVSKIMAVMR